MTVAAPPVAWEHGGREAREAAAADSPAIPPDSVRLDVEARRP